MFRVDRSSLSLLEYRFIHYAAQLFHYPVSEEKSMIFNIVHLLSVTKSFKVIMDDLHDDGSRTYLGIHTDEHQRIRTPIGATKSY